MVVPAYNSASTLKECLMAVRASAFRDYELIVVDSASTDETAAIAGKFADRVLKLESRVERSHARSQGANACGGGIIVNIDSDVLVRPETLGMIHDFFAGNPEVDAVTGILSTENPYPDFFSQYKNLYMHFIFKNLPERVTFLYGSVHAIRREARDFYISRAKVADDTALGQELVSARRRIAFMKKLEVVHLKKYGFLSWLKNDYQIPFDWAKIFIQYAGWKQLGKNGTGFAHASKKQLASVVMVPIIVILAAAHLFYTAWLLGIIWLALNAPFVIFLARQKGILFGLAGAAATFFDHAVMACGIACGFLYSLFEKTGIRDHK